MEFALHHGETHLHVRVPLLGQHSVHTALAAVQLDWRKDCRGKKFSRGCKMFCPTAFDCGSGENGIMLLDDT